MKFQIYGELLYLAETSREVNKIKSLFDYVI